MKHRSFIWFLAMLWIIAVPALSAFQVDQAVGSAATAEKKVKAKAKKADQSGQTEAESATSKAREATGARRPSVPESEIAAAKASGKVWVNTETGVYHKSGQWYGATKQGKFMTEQEAIKSGYRASKSK